MKDPSAQFNRARCFGPLRLLVSFCVLLGALGVVVVITWLPKWGSNQSEGGRKVVEVWGWNIAAESLDLLVPDFERNHPTVEVRVSRSGANLQSRFLLGMAAGVGAPDVSQLQEREAAKFTATGRLMDLTDLAGQYAEDFSPAFWESGFHDGRLYAIPWDMGPCAVFYKRWIFDRYGIDPDEIETWDDFIAAGVRLRQASGGATALMPLSSNSLPDLFLILMQQNGGGIFDDAGRIILHSPENEEVLATIRKMVDAGVTLAASGPELMASFDGDAIGAYVNASWFMNQIKDNTSPDRQGEWGMMRLPAFRSGGLRASNLGGSVLVIPSQSAQGLEAFRFIEWTNCTIEGQVAQYRNRGLFPAFLPALADPYFDQPDPFFKGQAVHRLLATDLDQIPAVFRTHDWNEGERMLRQTLSRWLSQQQDNGVYLRSVADALGRKIGRTVVDREEFLEPKAWP